MLEYLTLTLFVLLSILTNVNYGYVCDDLSNHPNKNLVDFETADCGVGAKLLAYNAVLGSLADLPWLLYMRVQIPTFDHQWTTDSFCAATLISPRYVVCAGHCIHGELPRKITVDILEYKLNWKLEYAPVLSEIRVEHIAKHKQIDAQGHNDISLLRLAQTIDIESTKHVKPICLPWSCELQRQGYYAGYYNLTAAGWGHEELTQDNFQKDTAQVFNLNVEHADYCHSKIPDKGVNHETQLCLVGASDISKVPCKADSGVPIMQVNKYNDTEDIYNYVLVGVVSWGPACGPMPTHQLPAVATRTPTFLRWILDNMFPWTKYEGDQLIGNHGKDFTSTEPPTTTDDNYY